MSRVERDATVEQHDPLMIAPWSPRLNPLPNSAAYACLELQMAGADIVAKVP